MIDAVIGLLDGLSAWQATLVVLALSLGGALIAEMVVIRGASRLVRRTDTQFDNIVVRNIRWPVVVSVGLVGIYVLTRTPAVVESTLITAEQLDTFFGRPSLVVIIVTWAWALNNLVTEAVEEVKERGSRFDFAPVFSNVWTLVVAVGTVAALLRLYNIDITPLLGAAGVAGIAVGFAAKDTVANFFGGIALYFDDTYKLGDYIVLDSGEAGTVVEVGIRSTTLMTRDEVLVTVPNSALNAAKIVNESAPQRRRRIRVPIGVAYGTDLDEFEELVVGIAEEESLVLDSPKPRMRFRRFGDSALEYELLCWVASPTRRARATHELNRTIYTALAARGIEIPYPKRDLTVTNVPGEADTPAGPSSPLGREESGEAVEGVPNETDGVPSETDGGHEHHR
ncbi:mechanosensitive ion channel family protein [Salinigranum rubrum]|uniref:mechanosensitive ion channel family protein n=1 Tax=Salinigranum rubrum TaxID=755307 RepID=UPI001FE8614B|nr:mechanosensitive ion channel family protein [Salinigranum rubrum]